MGSRKIDTWSWCCGTTLALALALLLLLVLVLLLSLCVSLLVLQADENSSLWLRMRELRLVRPLTETAVLRKEEEVGDEKKSYSKLSDDDVDDNVDVDDDVDDEYSSEVSIKTSSSLSLSLSSSSSISFGTSIFASPHNTSFNVFSVFVRVKIASSYSPLTI
jgi:hypothetical protein